MAAGVAWHLLALQGRQCSKIEVTSQVFYSLTFTIFEVSRKIPSHSLSLKEVKSKAR